MNLSFLGAAGTVTGSRYLVEDGGDPVLVDCGLFQGLKQLRLRNRAPFPVPVDRLASVILTHAHLDHSGYLPLLVRNGYEGRVLCTPATEELCGILLPDSGYLQEEEAARANRLGYSRHTPAEPLYTREDAQRSLQQLDALPLDVEHDAGGGMAFRFRRAGHIIGSASITLQGKRTLVFSGDLGRPHDPVLRPPERIARADYLVLESTYGDRLHPAEEPGEQLARVINRTVERDGVVVIPAFAVGRTQSLLYEIARLRARDRIPRLPVFVDSPMAINATELFLKHRDEHKLSERDCVAFSGVATLARTVEESKAINLEKGPMIVISASGMATGGRVLFHLERFAPDPRNTILFAGFQAAGTRGAAMIAGAERVRAHGRDISVRAEVTVLDGLSAHADADELIEWLRGFETAPRTTFLTHGEPVAADALRQRIERELGWRVHVPDHLEQVKLE
jgi:metallo-beta-lactamase family protein